MPKIDSLTLNDFATMVRMSAEGKFATSIAKTTGGIYVDDQGNVKNVRGKVAKNKGDGAQNLRLRQKLVDAFTRGHATSEFLNVVRDKLGLNADNTAAKDSARQTLDRRDVKALLSAFVQNEGNAEIGQFKATHRFEFKAETTKIEKSEWVEIADSKFEKLVNGLSKHIMTVFTEAPEKGSTFYERMLEKSGVEGMPKEHPPTSEAEIKELVTKIVNKNWSSNQLLTTFLDGKMNEDSAEVINNAMHDHLYTVKGQNYDLNKSSGLAGEFFRVCNAEKLGESLVLDIVTINGVKYNYSEISDEQKSEIAKVFPKPKGTDYNSCLYTPWVRDGAYLPLVHALITLLPPDFKDREKFLLFATNIMGYNGPSSIGMNPEIGEKDNGYGKIVDLFMMQGSGPVLVGDNGGMPKRMDLSVVNDESGKPKSLVFKQEYGIGPAVISFFGCEMKTKYMANHCVEMGRFETTVTIDLTQGLDENGKPHFTTTTVKLPDAQ